MSLYRSVPQTVEYVDAIPGAPDDGAPTMLVAPTDAAGTPTGPATGMPKADFDLLFTPLTRKPRAAKKPTPKPTPSSKE